jgi:Zn-dependent alcohol dehydrogenase
MSKIPGKAVMWGAVSCLVGALIVTGLRRTETIGDTIALPAVSVFVLGFVGLTILAGVRMARHRP